MSYSLSVNTANISKKIQTFAQIPKNFSISSKKTTYPSFYTPPTRGYKPHFARNSLRSVRRGPVGCTPTHGFAGFSCVEVPRLGPLRTVGIFPSCHFDQGRKAIPPCHLERRQSRSREISSSNSPGAWASSPAKEPHIALAQNPRKMQHTISQQITKRAWGKNALNSNCKCN